MSLRNEYETLKDAIRPAAYFLYRAPALIFGGEGVEIISDAYLKRGVLPNPLDLPNHVGNFREGAIITAGSFAMLGVKTVVDYVTNGSREKFRRGAQKVALGAVLLSSVVQVIGERYGISNQPGAENVGDMWDVAYGIGWSALVAYGGCRLAGGVIDNSIEKTQETFEAYVQANPASHLRSVEPVSADELYPELYKNINSSSL